MKPALQPPALHGLLADSCTLLQLTHAPERPPHRVSNALARAVWCGNHLYALRQV